MKYNEVLLAAAKVVDERANQYGSVDACFTRISKMASAFFGEEISEYKIAMILHFTKLGRVGDKCEYADNYIDGVNYLAFASHFSEKSTPASAVDRGINDAIGRLIKDGGTFKQEKNS